MFFTLLYMFNCYPVSQNNINSFALIRFDLKTKTFIRLKDDLPMLDICTFGQKLYAITCKNIQNQQLTLYRLEDERLIAVQTIPMEKHDFHIYFRKTTQNDWFAQQFRVKNFHFEIQLIRKFQKKYFSGYFY